MALQIAPDAASACADADVVLKVRHPTTATEGNDELALMKTAIACTRAIIAILENYQQADGSIAIPAPLQPYLKAERIAG